MQYPVMWKSSLSHRLEQDLSCLGGGWRCKVFKGSGCKKHQWEACWQLDRVLRDRRSWTKGRNHLSRLTNSSGWRASITEIITVSEMPPVLLSLEGTNPCTQRICKRDKFSFMEGKVCPSNGYRISIEKVNHVESKWKNEHRHKLYELHKKFMKIFFIIWMENL